MVSQTSSLTNQKLALFRPIQEPCGVFERPRAKLWCCACPGSPLLPRSFKHLLRCAARHITLSEICLLNRWRNIRPSSGEVSGDGHMIKSFKCPDTRRLFSRERASKFQAVEAVARRKLLWLDAASRLSDLATPPGNRLEALKGDRIGQHSVRINDQWRVCFRWKDGDAYEVEIVDYH
jgi:toxin HigB-1